MTAKAVLVKKLVALRDNQFKFKGYKDQSN